MFQIQAFAAENEQQNFSNSMQKLARDLRGGQVNCIILSFQHEPNVILSRFINDKFQTHSSIFLLHAVSAVSCGVWYDPVYSIESTSRREPTQRCGTSCVRTRLLHAVGAVSCGVIDDPCSFYYVHVS